jgi:hypothetical protein
MRACKFLSSGARDRSQLGPTWACGTTFVVPAWAGIGPASDAGSESGQAIRGAGPFDMGVPLLTRSRPTTAGGSQLTSAYDALLPKRD